MKKAILFAAFILFWGCEKDTSSPMSNRNNEIQCESLDCQVTTEWYGAGLLNGECWVAEWAAIDKSNSAAGLFVILNAGEVSGITEQLYFDLHSSSDFQDTIWLGGAYSNNNVPDLARTWYSYNEGHSVVGDFSFNPQSPLTYKDFLLVDYFNSDTSILEGYFQVSFPERSINDFVTHAPDSMNIQCGRFRAKAL